MLIQRSHNQHYWVQYISDMKELIFDNVNDLCVFLDIAPGTLKVYWSQAADGQLLRMVKHRREPGCKEQVRLRKLNKVARGPIPTPRPMDEVKRPVGRPPNDPTQHVDPMQENEQFLLRLPKAKRAAYVQTHPRDFSAATRAAYAKE